MALNELTPTSSIKKIPWAVRLNEITMRPFFRICMTRIFKEKIVEFDDTSNFDLVKLDTRKHRIGERKA